jgi:hypothetical protein
MSIARTRTTDSKGRVTLGERFANRVVIVEESGADEVRVKLARVIPEREAWLYENRAAFSAVRRGLSDAKKGRVSRPGPDLKKARKIAEQLPGPRE